MAKEESRKKLLTNSDLLSQQPFENLVTPETDEQKRSRLQKSSNINPREYSQQQESRLPSNKDYKTYNPNSLSETLDAVYSDVDIGTVRSFAKSFQTAVSEGIGPEVARLGYRYGKAGINKLMNEPDVTKEQVDDLIKQNNLSEYKKDIYNIYKKYPSLRSPSVFNELVENAKHRIIDNAIKLTTKGHDVANFAGGLAGGLLDPANFVLPGVSHSVKGFNEFSKLAKYAALSAEGAGVGAGAGFLTSWRSETEGEEVDYAKNIADSALFGAVLGPIAYEGINQAVNHSSSFKAGFTNAKSLYNPKKFVEKYKESKRLYENEKIVKDGSNAYTESDIYKNQQLELDKKYQEIQDKLIPEFELRKKTPEELKQYEKEFSGLLNEEYKTNIYKESEKRKQEELERERQYNDLTSKFESSKKTPQELKQYKQDIIELLKNKDIEASKIFHESKLPELKNISEEIKNLREQQNNTLKDKGIFKKAKMSLRNLYLKIAKSINSNEVKDLINRKNVLIKDYSNLFDKRNKFLEFQQQFNDRYNDKFKNEFRNDNSVLDRKEKEVQKLSHYNKEQMPELAYADYIVKYKEFNKLQKTIQDKYKNYNQDIGELRNKAQEYKNTANKIIYKTDLQDKIDFDKKMEIINNGSTATDYYSTKPLDNKIAGYSAVKMLNDAEIGKIPSFEGMPLQSNEARINNNIIKKPVEFDYNISDNEKLPVKIEYRVIDLNSLKIDFSNEIQLKDFDPNSGLNSNLDVLVSDVPIIKDGIIEYGNSILKHIYERSQSGELEGYINAVKEHAKELNIDTDGFLTPIIIKERINDLSIKDTKKLQESLAKKEKQLEYNYSDKINEYVDGNQILKDKANNFDKLLEISDQNSNFYVDTDTTTISNFAGLLNVSRTRFFSFLRESGYLWLPSKYDEKAFLQKLQDLGYSSKELSDPDVLKYISQDFALPRQEYLYNPDIGRKTGFFNVREMLLNITKEDGTVAQRMVPQTTINKQGMDHFISKIKDNSLTYDLIEKKYQDYVQRRETNRYAQVAAISKYTGRDLNEVQINTTKFNVNEKLKEKSQQEISQTSENNFAKYYDQNDSNIINLIQATGIKIQQLPRIDFLPNKFKSDIAGIDNIDFTYAIVNANDVQASHTTSYEPNPKYDSSKQPRNRDSKFSIAQIEKIANNIEPNKILISNDVKNGSPIVDLDLNVESGNGRTIGLQKAISLNKNGSIEYNTQLQKMAKQLGTDISFIDNPMLVRIRTTELTPEQVRDFTIKANQNEVLQQSKIEKSKQSIDQIDKSILDLYKGGEYGNLMNLNFTRTLLNKIFSQNEMASFFTTEGKLTVEGLNQIRSLMFQKAYNDATLDAEFRGSYQNEYVILTNVLDMLAPNVALIKENIAQGLLKNTNFDISSDIVKAVKNIKEAREAQLPWKQIMEQKDMWDKKTDIDVYLTSIFFNPETNRILSVDKIYQKLSNFIKSGIDQSKNNDTFSKLETSKKELSKLELLKEYIKNEDNMDYIQKYTENDLGISKYDKEVAKKIPQDDLYKNLANDIKDELLFENNNVLDEPTLFDIAKTEVENIKAKDGYIDNLFDCITGK